MDIIQILIVDDAKVIRERLAVRLSKNKVIGKILHADTIARAISVFQENKPEIVLLDMELPDGSGIDFISKIKKEQTNTLVIILTNYPYAVLRNRCLSLGADYFFDKSTEFEKVFDVISSFS
jgi:DNA-binding NarL/FixJ family response regulator